MPKIEQSGTITVHAPAEVAFDLVVDDVMKVDDDPDTMVGHRPLDPGPVREGFRWRQRVVHNRQLCGTDWRVEDVVRPRHLEQTMVHFCADTQREVRGGERWEFRTDGAGHTVVELRHWRIRRGLTGWLERLFGDGSASAAAIALSKRLAYVQFEAERRARSGP